MKSALRISAKDNVVTALEPLAIGASIDAGDGAVKVREAIPSGHKMAIAPIGAGAAVIKYGSAIGVATQAIQPGDHVHTHNLSSGRGRGDLSHARVQTEPGVRLAEPVEGDAPDTENAEVPARGGRSRG